MMRGLNRVWDMAVWKDKPEIGERGALLHTHEGRNMNEYVACLPENWTASSQDLTGISRRMLNDFSLLSSPCS